jgi:polyisoprenoid-binding protein YceI
MRNKIIILLSFFAASISSQINAAEYMMDTKGMHGYINFEVSHMGFSMLGGRFNQFEGSFSWDKSNPASSSAEVTINTSSISTNNETRDGHLSGENYLNVAAHPSASFKSSSYKGNASGGKLMGDFTLNGVTKPVTLDVSYVGEGDDPWGGYRSGFTGSTVLNSKDFNYTNKNFPASIAISISVEGIRQ